MNFSIQELHERTLQHLLSKEIFFITRKINRAKRLEKGMWFHGDNHYMNISFWHGYDNDRKVNNIGLGFELDKQQNIYLYLTGRNDSKKGKLLKKISNNVGAKSLGPKNLWSKDYQFNVTSIDEYINKLDEFIEGDKKIIDRILESEQDKSITFITADSFSNQIEKINKFRSNKSLIDLNISTLDKDGFLLFGRKGVDNIDDKDYNRTQKEKSKKVSQYHKRLQKLLKEQLIKEDPKIQIKFEYNYIDLLAVSKGVNLLIEVKTHKSVINCIREGLGQLLFYYSKYLTSTKKEIKLIIAGPNPPNDESKEFIRFIKRNISPNFQYIAIDQN